MHLYSFKFESFLFNFLIKAVAREIIALNDKRNVIRLIRARSQDVRFDASCDEETLNCIPLQANVLISETLATDVNGEFWMGGLFDMRRRGLLTSDCVIVPSSATVYGQVMWSSYGMPIDYRLNGFDLTPLAVHRSSAIRGVEISSTYTLNFTEPIELVTYDYQHYHEPEPAGAIPWLGTLRTAKSLRDGTLNGIGVWWQAQLSPSVRLSTQQGIKSCWGQNIIVMPLDHSVQRDEEIDIGTVHNGHITFTAVQPRRLREHKAWLRIQSWSPLTLDVWWEEPQSKEWMHRGTIQPNDVMTNNIGVINGKHCICIFCISYLISKIQKQSNNRSTSRTLFAWSTIRIEEEWRNCVHVDHHRHRRRCQSVDDLEGKSFHISHDSSLKYCS